jgi:glycosyltransferase involved in cell wall biosynthesis
MRICHFSNFAPSESGMYESVKDAIKYERQAGYSSEIVVSHVEDEGAQIRKDGWLESIPWEEAKKADVWVLHSAIPEPLKELGKSKVRVAVLHGPTEHMLLKEWAKGGASFNLHVNLLWEYDATVCLNQHEYDIMKFYDEKVGRCRYIPNSIDLEQFKNISSWQYQHHPAILSCDTPRIEKLPFHIIWAMPFLQEDYKLPDARLNIYSLPLEPIAIWRGVFCRSHQWKLEKCCENIQLANNDLRPFQAGVDIGFNNNYSGIASRVTMEMMACGVPIVSYGGEYTKYHAKIFDLPSIAEQINRCWRDLTAEGSTLKEETLAYARENFDRSKNVKQYIQLYKELLAAK